MRTKEEVAKLADMDPELAEVKISNPSTVVDILNTYTVPQEQHPP